MGLGGEGGAVKRKSWGLGGVEVFGRLEGLLPPPAAAATVWSGLRVRIPPPHKPRPREVSQTMAVPNVLSHERRKKKKRKKRELVKSERLRLERSSATDQVGEWWGEGREGVVRPARCLLRLRLPLPGNWSSS